MFKQYDTNTHSFIVEKITCFIPLLLVEVAIHVHVVLINIACCDCSIVVNLLLTFPTLFTFPYFSFTEEK